MPELPEVEIVRGGLEQALCGRVIEEVIVRRRRLRRLLPSDFARRLMGRRVQAVTRRGKYLLLAAPPETCIVHLGMTGGFSLSVLPPAEKHAHIAFRLDSGCYLIYTDPRRFGLMTLTQSPPQAHPLLASIGLEPLSRAFSGRSLRRLLQDKKTPVKTALMDSHLLAGVGNIYASESLFAAGIHPCRRAGALTADDCRRLAAAVKKTLRRALAAGGSSMRNFAAADGKRGYFQTRWAVYARAGQPCLNTCGGTILQLRLAGRSTYYCPGCQPPPEAGEAA